LTSIRVSKVTMVRRQGCGLIAAALCTCLLLAVAASPALGAKGHGQRHRPSPGALDRSFGSKGKVIGFAAETPAETRMDPIARPHTTDFALGPGGTIAVAVGTTVAEFGPNGKLLRDFGEGGRVSVTVPGGEFALAGIAIDGRGRVLVAGTMTPIPVQAMQGPGQSLSVIPTRAVVLRYTPTGALDPSFGLGGILVSDLGAPHPFELPDLPGPRYTFPQAAVSLTGIALDGLERPVLSGFWVARPAYCYAGPTLFRHALAARLDQTGHLDPNFGTAGLSAAPGEPANVSGTGPGVSLDPLPLEGQTILTVVSDECLRDEAPTVTLDQLGDDGALNPAFGAAGKVEPGVETTPSTTLDPQGRILVAATMDKYGKPTIRLRRFRSDGSFQRNLGDRSLGEKMHPGVWATRLGVDARSRPLLLTTFLAPKERRVNRFKLERLKPNGATDRRFGRNGATSVGFGALAWVTPAAVAVDSRGRILIVGHREVKDRPDLAGFAIARFLP
jgi:uncharacterized delta-60 repeat protein